MKKTIKKFLYVMILFVIPIIYFGYRYNEKRQEELLNVYNNGAQLGSKQAVLQLISETVKCEPVPISFENININMINVECLDKPI